MPNSATHREYFVRLSQNRQLSPELYAAAEAYLAREQQKAQRSGKRMPFRALNAAEQARYMAEHFDAAPPEGLGVRQGHYIALSREEATPQRRFIATDFLMDCHALILVGRDATGTVQHTIMAHVDRYTDLATSVPALLQLMPENSRVEATIIGGSKGYNHYLHGGLLHVLSQAPAVTRIREGVDAGSTVAVDTHTGQVLVALTPEENEATSYHITELPMRIDFGPTVLEGTNGSILHLQRAAADLEGTPASLPLQRAYDAVQGVFIERDALGKELYQLQTDDQKLSRADLLQLVGSISSTLQTSVTIDYEVAENQLTTMRVYRERDQASLGVMYATLPDAALGRNGRVSGR